LGDYYHNQYGDGNRDVIAPLTAEEANLLHARPLVGSQLAYTTIELPPGVAAARASVQLSADVASGFRSALGFLPERDSARLSWVLGE
jgi:hypothetical protein